MKLLLLLLFSIPFICMAQDTIKTKGVFVSIRKQNPMNVIRFYSTSFIVFRSGNWYNDKGKVIPYRLVYRMEENDQLVAIHSH